MPRSIKEQRAAHSRRKTQRIRDEDERTPSWMLYERGRGMAWVRYLRGKGLLPWRGRDGWST